MRSPMKMKALTLHHFYGAEAEQRYHLPSRRDLFKQRMPTIDAGDPKLKAEQIRCYVHNTMEIYERLYDSLGYEESFYVPPIHNLRHPMIFYYGHTAAFYINKLCVAGLTPRINPRFEEMFGIGVDEMSWDDLNEAHYDWPPVEQVCSYRRAVRDRIDELMRSSKFPLELPLTFANSTKNDANAFWWVMLMGAEHERIHLETASVHVRELPLRYVRPSMNFFRRPCQEVSPSAPTNELVAIKGGSVVVGRAPDSSLYGWDCDYSDGKLTTNVADFRVSRYLVSNAEFFAFMKADGYKTRRYWDEEGWNWVQWKKPEHPWFWVKEDSRPDGYALRLQTELIDLPWNWPCELNNLEAKAFCNFKAEQLKKPIRMLTEEEWLLLFDRYVGVDQPGWDGKGDGGAPGNLNLEHYHSSCPVDKYRHGDLYDVVGNVWQHCETTVYPYRGYRVQPFYDDFSMPTFDGRHACMKGGAWISTGNEATRDARFAFRRHFFQFIGLRYVEGGAVTAVPTAGLTQAALGLDPEVDIITDTHFRDSFAGIANGCRAIAQYAAETFADHAQVPAGRAMDIACGGGRVSYELALYFDEVIGVDYTARRLVPAFAMRERGSCQYSVPARADGVRTMRTVDASTYDWGTARGRVTFFQADPTNLHVHLDHFSLIVCWDCLERSYRPSAIPSHLLSRLEKGGLLIIGGDYNWDNIKITADDATKSESSYVSDPLIRATGDMQEQLFQLLGGDAAVERVGKVVTIPVAYPRSETSAQVRLMQLAAYRKK